MLKLNASKLSEKLRSSPGSEDAATQDLSSSAAATPVLDETIEDVFKLLRRKGPLCVSQISIDLHVSGKTVKAALANLKERGIVEVRPDANKTQDSDEALEPWGLATSFTQP